MSERVTRTGAPVTRNGDARLASRMERLRQERENEDREREEARLHELVRAALRVCLLSVDQADRPAVAAVAAEFGTDDSTVYRWASGDLRCYHVLNFLKLVRACQRGKGAHNPNGVELVRLAQRLFLDAREPEHASPSVVKATAGDMAEVVGITIRQLLRAVSHESEGGESLTPEEARALAPHVEEVCRLAEELRLALPAYVRQGRPMREEGLPS